MAYSERMKLRMRWLWRILTLSIVLVCLRTLVPQPEVFISWPEKNSWAPKVQGQIKQLQQFTQDLPASIEVEVRRLWQDYQPSGDGKEV